MKKILFFGDSLTAGYGLVSPATQSFPSLIQHKINLAGLPYSVINGGVSGETSAGGLNRLPYWLRDPVDVFILELGINDFFRGYTAESTFNNLDKIVKQVRKKFPDCKIAIMGMEIPIVISHVGVNEFKGIFRRLADKHQTVFVPFFLEGVIGVANLNMNDGIHPTAKGYEVITEKTWPYIKPMLAPD